MGIREVKLSEREKQLIKKAACLVNPKKIRGEGELKEVGCALLTAQGEEFIGVCLDLQCGIGFCAEHTAIAQMVTQTDETHVKTIVAYSESGIIPPCGRCRELLNLLDEKNMDTEVIIGPEQKVTLQELLPHAWEDM